MAFGLMAFLAVAFLGAGIAMRMQQGNRVLQRIVPSTKAGTVTGVLEEVAGDPLLVRIAQPFVSVLGRLSGPVGKRKGMDTLRQRLALAGNPGGLSAEEFFALSAGIGLVAGIVATGIMVGRGPTGLLGGIAVGLLVYNLANTWLSARITARQRLIRRDLLSWIDSMATVADAGASLSDTVRHVSERMPGLLAREAYQAWGEAQAGGDLGTALERMANRFGVDELSHVVSVLRQQMDLGTGVSRILRTQASYLRGQRRLRVEEAAQKATPKMLLPMLMVLGATLLIELYPSLSRAGSMFGGGL